MCLYTGYQCEEHNNPPDFFLDVINGDSSALAGVGDMVTKPDAINVEDRAVNMSVAEELCTHYERSKYWHE